MNLQKNIYRICDIQAKEFKINYHLYYTIAGTIINSTILLTTKSKEEWAELVMEDFWGSIQVMVYSKAYSESAYIFDRDECDETVIITGYLHNDNGYFSGIGGLKMIATEIDTLAIEHLKPELYTSENYQLFQNNKA